MLVTKLHLRKSMLTKLKNDVINYLTLFSSMSTLLCCALPSLLVSLGMGAALAGLVSDFPQLIWLSEHKVLLFVISGLLLAGNGLLLWKTRNAPCPIDLNQREACLSGRKYSKIVYWVSLVIFITGVTFTFILPLFYPYQ